jgi:predicted KAP-like P-loop ATPase
MFGTALLKRLLSRTSSEKKMPAVNEVAADLSEEPGPRYASDQPIKSKEDDRFNRWPFAKRLADTLATRNDPRSLVIALYGPWGDGKTSTLRMMQAALGDHPNVVTIEFNPWLFGSDEQLMRGFFATLAAALDRSLPTKKEKIGSILEQYGSLLSVSVGGVMQLGIGEAAKGLGRALSAVELEDLRRRIERFLNESGRRVVVLIDDVDRLDRTEIHSIFKLVKLSASFEHTSYVLAFDDTVVAAALSESYGRGLEGAGRSFLEKIIQVPLHLPPPDKYTLRKMIFEGVEEALSLSEIVIPKEQAGQFANRFVMGVEPALRTPRQVNLYANALIFALPLLKGRSESRGSNADRGGAGFLSESVCCDSRQSEILFGWSPRFSG